MSSVSSTVLAGGAGLTSLYAAMMPPVPRLPAIDIHATAAAAYREGLAAGIAEAMAEMTSERALMKAAQKAFEAAMVVDSAAIRGAFVTLVRSLAQTVIDAELRISPAVINQLVDAALVMVMPESEAVVRVHPDDAPYLETAVIIDPSLVRGTVVIEAAQFVVAAGLDARLTALIEALL